MFFSNAVYACSSSVCNTVMEAAAKYNSPVIIQASNGGAQFMAGKSIKDKKGAAGEFIQELETVSPHERSKKRSRPSELEG